LITKVKNLFSSDFSKILLSYASSQVVGNILRMIAGFLTVRLVAPEVFGTFSGKGIFLGYLSLAHIGVLNGLNRELPVEQGRGNIEKVKELAGVGYWVSMLIGIPSALFLIALGFNSLFQSDTQEAIIYFTYATSAFLLLLTKFYLPVLYRTNQDFTLLTKITIYTSIINILSVAFVWWQENLLGLCIRLVLLNLVEFGFLYFFRPVRVSPKWSLNGIKQLLKTGVPIFVVGYIGPLWDTVKNSIIFSLGGGIQFGYFALSNVVSGAVGMIPLSFSQIIYPKMAIAFGKGEEMKANIKATYKPMLLLFGISCFIAIVSFVLLEPMVKIFLPKYIEGVDTALWTLGLPIVSSFSLINNYFAVYRKQALYLIAILSGIAVSGLYLFIYYKLYSFHIVMFPQSMLIGALVQNFLCWVFIFGDLKKESTIKTEG
jgi:O-antigen/teichoic acid export membrane protein